MNQKTVTLLGFIALKFLLQYNLIIADYDLQRDEYLHLDQAHHPAWGYLSVPPLTSWISRLIFWLGGSVFWVKFFPALFGALTIYVVWKGIELLDGNLSAQVLGALAVFFSALLRLNTLYQPNSFDVLSWTGFYYFILRYYKTTNSKWLYVAAVLFALGFLNKYNIAFLLVGIIPAILITEQRTILKVSHLYFAAFSCFLLLLPNLLWQYNNGFPVLRHMEELRKTQLVHVAVGDFLKPQLLFFSGGLILILAGFYALLFYQPFRKYRFFFWSYLFTMAAFLYFKAKDYYAIGIYPVYIAFGSVYLDRLLTDGWKKYIKLVLFALPLLLFIPLYNVGFPDKTPSYIIKHQDDYRELGLLRWEDGKDHHLPQDFADMLGWKELAAIVDSI